MIIKFDELESVTLDNFYGGNKSVTSKMFKNDLGKIMFGKLEPGASIGEHTHTTSSEYVYVLNGTAKAIFDGKEERLTKGVLHYCPKGHTHTVINDSNDDLEFLAIVPEQ